MRVRSLLDCMTDGRAKLYLTWKLLQSRKQWPAVFQEGVYVPLITTGPRKDHLCAFARQLGDIKLIVAAPRWFSRLIPAASGELPLGDTVWNTTAIEAPNLIAGMQGINVLTGETVEVSQVNDVPGLLAPALFASFPVALLRF